MQKEQLADLNVKKLEKENAVLKQDLCGFQERCETLETELRIAKGDNQQKQLQDSQMEQELQRLRDSTSK